MRTSEQNFFRFSAERGKFLREVIFKLRKVGTCAAFEAQGRLYFREHRKLGGVGAHKASLSRVKPRESARRREHERFFGSAAVEVGD